MGAQPPAWAAAPLVAVIDEVPWPIAIVDAAGSVVWANAAMATLGGLDPAGAPRPLARILVASDAGRWMSALEAMRDGALSVWHRYIELLPAGADVSTACEGWVRTLGGTGDRFAGALVILRDVSAEETLRRRLGSLRGVVKHVLDLAPVGLAIGRPDGRVVEVNDTLVEMLGEPSSDVLARSLLDIVDAAAAGGTETAGVASTGTERDVAERGSRPAATSPAAPSLHVTLVPAPVDDRPAPYLLVRVEPSEERDEDDA